MQLARTAALAGFASVLLFLSGTGSVKAGAWKSAYYVDHRLVGKIWSSSEQKFISRKSLEKQIAKARFVLLGETHTNRDHHRLQAHFLDVFAQAATKPPRLVVEMVPEGLIDKLDTYRQQHRDDTKNLGTVLQWKKRGWGDWTAYQPIFDVAYKHRLEIFAGNLDTGLVRKLARKGVSVLSSTRVKELALDVPYTAAQKTIMTDLLFTSHCELMPKEHLAPMLKVQAARDGKMASAMLTGKGRQKAALIAGNGHIRKDLAVPRLLRMKAAGDIAISLAFSEVKPGNNLPQQYEIKGADNKVIFDYLYFTPVGDIKDHCAELAKRFGKTGKKKQTHGKSNSK